MMDSFYPLINEICEDYSIRCEALSGGWLLRLEKNGKVRSIIGRHFDVNSASADRVACDKCACYEMLKRGGIEAVECELFLDPLRRRNWIGVGGEFSRATDYFFARGQKVVVKPNEGWQGREVYLCETVKQLERAMLAAYKEGPGICLSPFAEIKNEYRAYHVNGECPLAYGKERASAIGDGCSTVSQFAKESRVPDDCHYFPKGPDYVPAPGERALLSWKHNLSNGARAFFIGDAKLKNKIIDLAIGAARRINIAFATVDIVELADGSLCVMEINSGVTANRFLEQHPHRRDDIKKIYAAAVEAMFK